MAFLLRTLTPFAVALCGWTMAASAQAPSAIVESVAGPVEGVEYMDYVAPGQVIKLGAKGKIVLAYFSSCARETIAGGVVIVGTEQSRVSLGDVSRETPLCNRAQAEVPDNVMHGGGVVYRNAPHRQRMTEQRRLTIYSSSPVIEVSEAGALVIERLGRSNARPVARLSSDKLVKQRFFDLATSSTQLKPGGTYRATVGSRSVVFKIDPLATTSGPLLGRLIRL